MVASGNVFGGVFPMMELDSMKTDTKLADRRNSDFPGIIPPFDGRRRGDAILVALNHALNQNDLEVARQLLAEYQSVNGESRLLLTVDRRTHQSNPAFVLNHLWERIRSKFS
jgi:hypothetical protein